MPLRSPISRVSRASLDAVGVLGAALVLVGGLVTAEVPESSWASTIWLRDTMHGRMLGLTVVEGSAFVAAPLGVPQHVKSGSAPQHAAPAGRLGEGGADYSHRNPRRSSSLAPHWDSAAARTTSRRS